MQRSRAAARATYDRLSPWYDRLAGRRERELMLAGLAGLKAAAGEAVLELGCGTGHAVAALSAAVGRTGFVAGLDLSSGMLSMARRNVWAAGSDGAISLVRGDGACPPFRPGSFDAVFMSFTLELFDTPELAQVLQACRRVLKPAGRLGVVGLSRSSGRIWTVRLYEWAHRMFPSVADCRPILMAETISTQGFRIVAQSLRRLWGLPVEIVIARPQQE